MSFAQLGDLRSYTGVCKVLSTVLELYDNCDLHVSVMLYNQNLAVV